MLHGVIWAQHADRLATAEPADFRSEVRTFFGSGVQLQELYLSPELLTEQGWDDLAAAAKWARSHADILKDAHWIGGDPSRLEPYGWAAWTPRLGLVTLRNPSATGASFRLDPGRLFELPAGAAGRFQVRSAYADTRVPMALLEAGQPVAIDLSPFQVLVLELQPTAMP